MRGNILFADKAEAGYEKNSAEAVEGCVDGGKIGETHGSRSSLRMDAIASLETLFGSMPSPSVSRTRRNWPFLSMTTKIVLWTKRSLADSRSLAGFSSAASFKESV